MLKITGNECLAPPKFTLPQHLMYNINRNTFDLQTVKRLNIVTFSCHGVKVRFRKIGLIKRLLSSTAVM